MSSETSVRPALQNGCSLRQVGYTLLPFDLIPDFLPLIGPLNDAVIVPRLIYLALRMIPRKIIEECREQAKN